MYDLDAITTWNTILSEVTDEEDNVLYENKTDLERFRLFSVVNTVVISLRKIRRIKNKNYRRRLMKIRINEFRSELGHRGITKKEIIIKKNGGIIIKKKDNKL